MNTECGVLGFFNKKDLSYELVLFKKRLNELQHRGQDSCGIGYLSTESKEFIVDKYIGLVKNNFTDYSIRMKASIIVGHTRYATSGKKGKMTDKDRLKNSHPIVGNFRNEPFLLVYNGNIPYKYFTGYFNKNCIELPKNINKNEDDICDTNLIVHFIEQVSFKKSLSLVDTLIEFITFIKRAFNIILVTKDTMYILRDQLGTRPLLYFENDEYCMVGSETNSIDLPIHYNSGVTPYIEDDANVPLECKLIKDILPGKLYIISKVMSNEISVVNRKYKGYCLFEYIYFMDKDSSANGYSVTTVRYDFGMELAIQEKLDPDFNPAIFRNKQNVLVIGSPNSGIIGGMGYANGMGLEYSQAITKNKDINRTFILENNIERSKASKLKYIYDTEEIKGKIIVLCDDSIVRGITMKNVVEKLFNIGAKEVHIRVTSPKIRNPCYYGVDIPTRKELIANKYIDVNKYIKATSIIYLNLENMGNVLKLHNFCMGCMNGNYNDIDTEW